MLAMDISFEPILDAGDKLIFALGFGVDTSSKVKLQEKLSVKSHLLREMSDFGAFDL